MNTKSIFIKKILLLTTIIGLIVCVDSCKKDSSEKSIDQFLFEASKNPGLSNDVVAEIDDDRINAILPYGVDIKSLIATFSYAGVQVSVNGKSQTSGVTANDFSSTLLYVVQAEDNSTRRYIVNVKINDNTFSKFEFKKSLNLHLPADVSAIIRNDSVIAEFPVNTNVSALVATYITMATSVTVNGIKQNSGISSNNFNSTVEYAIEGIDGVKKTYKAVAKADHSFTKFEIKKSLNPALSEDIVFAIDHQNLVIEASYLKWIEAENPSRLVVSFETDGVSVTSGGADLQSKEIVVDFKQSVQFTTTYGKNEPRTYSVNLICPQINATLPVLRLEADAPITSKEDYVKAKLEILGNGITEGLWDFSKEKIEIRLRGNSTMGLPKKPYRIKFPEKYSPLGLNHAKEKSWVLLANDCDKTLIRNAVAFEMSRILSADAATPRFTPCTQFVDVYLNGTYDGNYHLTDQVEVAKGRVNVQSLNKKSVVAEISGGYLLELDGFAASEPLHFYSPKNMPVTIKYPKDDDYAQEQADWIKNHFWDTENALFSITFKEAANGWRKYIDQVSWVDYYIISEFTGNSDAWWSTYMSKERDVDQFLIGPIWDFDIAFNNDNRIGNAPTRLMADVGHDPKAWIARFMQDETFKAAVKTRWNAKKVALSALVNYVDGLAVQLDASQKANFKRWNITHQALQHANRPPESYEAGIAELKTYLQDRYKFLDGEFNKW